MPGGIAFRAGGVVVLLGTLTLVLLPSILTAPTDLPRRHGDAARLLEEAKHLAFLQYNWLDAAPLFAAAEAQFAAQGDERNALLARIGRLRGEVEFGSVPETSRELGEILRSLPVKQDQRLRLLCLVAKGDIDFQIDPRSAREVWSEVKALARELSDELWENRASAELGKIAFYEGLSVAETP